MVIGRLSGGCLCGTVKYKYSGQFGPANYCHCRDCRRVTGSAFNVGIRLDASGLRVIAGQVKGFTKIGSSGNVITREFCLQCGSPLFTRTPTKPEIVWVKAGSVDQPELIEPAYQIWTNSQVLWAHIPPELPSYCENRVVQKIDTSDVVVTDT
jgi:hypothetical protein